MPSPLTAWSLARFPTSEEGTAARINALKIKRKECVKIAIKNSEKAQDLKVARLLRIIVTAPGAAPVLPTGEVTQGWFGAQSTSVSFHVWGGLSH